MKILTFKNNSMGQNIYMCHCEETGEGIIIDAGCSTADEKAIMKVINENGITVKAILLTHGHYDHLIAVEKIKKLTNAEVYCHASEKQFLENPEFNLSWRTGRNISVVPDKLLNDSDVLTFGTISLKVLHTPGHTPGGVCYYSEKACSLFSGDTLFKGSVGRTDLPLGDHDKLMRNIAAKLLVLPDETVVYPGHGNNTDIRHEKKSNPFLK